MKKRKLMALALSMVMVISMTACGTKNKDGDSKNTSTPKPTATSSPSTDGDATGTVSGEKVVITYANWNLGSAEDNNIERRMIAEFNATHPNIEVVVAENVDMADYNGSLTTLASAGNLPDVIMISNIPDPYRNKWLADITSIAEADGEWNEIIGKLRETAYVNGKVVVVPFAIHFVGILQNDEAFEKTNVSELSFNPSMEEFDEKIAAVTKPEEGVVGIKFENDLVNFIPAALNSDLGYFTFDGEGYSLDGTDFMNAMKKVRGYRTDGYTFNGLSESQKANFQANADYEAWVNGEAAINFDGTWALGRAGIDFTFKVTYKGMLGGRTVIVPDYFGVSASSKHPKEAFEFMKWMSYSKEGFSKRIDIAKDMGTSYFGMPMTQDTDLLSKFFSYIPIDGLELAYTGIENAIVEPQKIVPGYGQSRWGALTGLKVGDKENASVGDIIAMAIEQGINYADYAKTVNELANGSYQEALEAIK